MFANRLSHRLRSALSLVCSMVALVVAPAARGEIGPKSQEALEEHATVILVGTVESVGGIRRRGLLWDDRDWAHRLKVERVLRGDGIEVGSVVPVRSASHFWRLPFASPAYGTGHRPLPLPGERCTVYARSSDRGQVEALLPNGWVLPAGADSAQRERWSTKTLQDPSAAIGWMIFALGIAAVATAVRRSGAKRVVVLVLGAIMLGLGGWLTV